MKKIIHALTCISIITMTLFGQTQTTYSILIDPGHGGTDIGAPGTDGITAPNESDINLTFGDMLQSYLIQDNITPELGTYMTRTSDDNVTVEDRVSMAKGEIADAYWFSIPKNGDGTKFGVDFFFSIHCNSPGTTSQGTLALIYDDVADQTPSNKNTNDYKFAKNVVAEYVNYTKNLYTGASIRTSQYPPDGVGGQNTKIWILNNTHNKNSDGMPQAVSLLETEFTSNSTTWNWLNNTSYDLYGAQGMEEGIKDTKGTITGACDLCPPYPPTGFSVTIVGQNIVLTWDPYTDQTAWGLSIFKNGTNISGWISPVYTTSYTDNNGVSSLPATYKVDAWNDYGDSYSQSINVITSPSTINSSTIWTGVVYINSNVIVTTGTNLVIGNNTKVMFDAGHGYSLTVNGTLSARGIQGLPIIFTTNALSPTPGSWSWVQVKSGNSVFQYCTFEYGTYGLYLLNASSGSPVDIENCTMCNNSSYGMKLYSSNAKVKSCEIKNNNSHGIICNNDPDIKFIGNSIHNNSSNGIYSMVGGFLELYGNVMTSNGWYGLGTGGSNHIHLGQPYTWEGYNTIKNNTSDEVNIGSGSSNIIYIATASIHDVSGGYDVINYSSNPAVYATDCHWGPYRLNRFSGPITFGVVFDDSAAWDGQTRTAGSPLGKVGSTTVPDSIPWILDPRIPDTEKVKKCKDIIAKNPKSEEAKTALDWLYSVVRPDFVDNKLSERDNFYNYLQGLYKISGDANIGKTALQYMIYWKMLTRDNTAVIRLSNQALTVMSGEDKKWVLVDLALTHSHIGQKSQARNILQDLRQNYGIDNELISIISNDINEIYVPNADEQNQMNKQAQPEEQVVVVPKEFGFSENYPNPFNPTTTINYQIPITGHITLKVFDILGREVTTLVDGMKDAGSFAATFDGSRLSSGVYFVRMTALSQNGSQSFTKTMKMLMMK